VQVGILGPLEVRDADGRPIEVAGARLRALLVRLALDAGRPVSVTALVDAVWGEQPPTDAANALQTLVSRLRRTLRDAALVGQSPAGYRLDLAHEDVDAHRFQALAAAGAAALRAGDARAAEQQLDCALALWRGPALPEAGPELDAVARQLADQQLAARLNRADALLTLGRAVAVVPELEALAAEHPLHERLAALLVTALAGAGRPADALHFYDRVRTRLAGELGVDPSPNLQAVHLAVLRGELSSPEPPRRRRTNLKAQLTSFIGRDDEVRRIAKALKEHRLVTLVGPGGAGKTRLAGEAAATIVDSAEDGIWLVELASVSDAADLPQTVLGSLGIREAHLLDRRAQLSARDAAGRLQEILADKDAVLVLDNCEHLVDASARLADVLLAECPRLRILTTSREPLGIVGEVLLVVPPLGQPEPGVSVDEALGFPSVRLFADRGSAVRPDFEVDEATVATVIEIVRRLDGLPLAIELAAARLRSLALAEISDRLSDRFRLLTGGSRTALPRHRTLRAVVEWSWELLTPAERVLAERLSVFPAGATAASAAAVCADEDGPVAVAAADIDDLLASLVDKSLLQPVVDGSRLRMLETIREYGSDRLAERGELRAVRARHATYFADLVHEAEPHLISRDQLPWFALLTAERDNIMAALRFRCDQGDADGALTLGVSIGGFAMLLGNHAEVPLWLADALAVPGGDDRLLRCVAEALYSMNAATSDGQSEVVDAGLELMKVSVEDLRDVDVEGHPLIGLLRPAVAHFAGRPELAAQFIAEAVAGSHPWVAAAAVMFRGAIAENDGDVATMRADVAWSLAEFRRLGERWGTATTLRSMAQLHTLDGDLDAAAAAYDEALDVMAEMNSRDDEAFLRVRMADICLRRGDLDGARAQLQLARESTDATGSLMETVFTLCVIAGIEAMAGDLVEARRLHADALKRMNGMPPGHPVQSHAQAMVLGISARLSALEGDVDAAAEQVRIGFAAALETKDRPIIASIGVVVAELTAQRGEPARAARMLGAAAALRGAPDHTAVDVRRLTATLTEELGAPEFAAEYAEGQRLDHEAAQTLLTPA
jgi:predicted ATPase/DNA-binding SARP family transcriptional activator